jgi:ATP-dependent DNA helicase PIF1
LANESGKISLNIPDDLLIQDSGDPLRSLIDFVYPDFLKNMKKPKFFQEHGILPPTLDTIEHVNDYLISLVPESEQ